MPHFLYFKKWKEVFPNAKRKNIRLAAHRMGIKRTRRAIILNDPRIQEILHRRARFYSSHRRIKIGKLTAPAFSRSSYRRRKDFDSFLRDGRIGRLKHRKNVRLCVVNFSPNALS